MPFVRCTRDKRGYEHIYLMHAYGRRGKPSKPRLLYWFRTPPGVKVGREPFDESVRRTIEAQNPGVAFDWKKLSVIPQAPVDVEYWRERRRSERAAKQARRVAEAVPVTAESDALEDVSEVPEPPELTIETSDADEEEAALTDQVADEEISDEADASDAPAIEVSPAAAAATPDQVSRSTGRRRRRRGGRRRRRKHSAPAPNAGPIQEVEAASSSSPESAEPPKATGDSSKDE